MGHNACKSMGVVLCVVTRYILSIYLLSDCAVAQPGKNAEGVSLR